MQRLNFHGLDVSVNAMNDALYAQGFVMPVNEAGALNTTCLVTLACSACTLVNGLQFYAYPKGHGNQKQLGKEQRNKTDRTMRILQKHYQSNHPDQARQPAPRRGKRSSVPEDRVLTGNNGNDQVQGGHVFVAETLTPVAKRARIDEGAHVQLVEEAQQVPMQVQIVQAERQPQQLQLAVCNNYGNAAPTNLMTVHQPAVACLPGQMMVPFGASGLTSMQRRQVAPGLVNEPSHAVQLPCMMQMEFMHPQFGSHQVWALLLWVDECERTVEDVRKLSQRTESGESMRDRFVGSRGMSISERKLYIHRIEHITPIGSPLAVHVGQYFSSLFASAEKLAGKKQGLDVWHLVHQPHVKLATIIAEQGFCQANWMQSLTCSPARKRDILSTSQDDCGQPRLRLSMILTNAEMEQLMDEEGPDDAMQRPGRVPAWIHSRDKATFNRHHMSVGDITLRDCLASQCNLECNELECIDDDIKPGQYRTCRHGVSHKPFEAICPVENIVKRTAFSGDKLVTTHTKAIVEAEPLQLVARRVVAAMTNDNKSQKALREATSAWERRIRFEYIRTNEQLRLTRRFCKHLSLSIVDSYIYGGTPGSMCSSGNPRARSLQEMSLALRDERVLDSSTKLEELMRHGAWHPQSADVTAGELHSYTQFNTFPIRWVSKEVPSQTFGTSELAPPRAQLMAITNSMCLELGRRLELPQKLLLPEVVRIAQWK